MFCPKCGQQQASEDVRFCSRCGLSLGAVAQVLEGGSLPATRAEGHRALTKRQRGMRKGFMLMAGSIGFAALVVLLTLMKDDFFILMPLAVVLFIAGLMRLLYGWLLEEEHAADAAGKRAKKWRGGAQSSPALEGTHARGGELPPARGFSATDFASRRTDTNQIRQPPSVTEHTTKLLSDEADNL